MIIEKIINKNDEECCGASFEKNNISYFGLITLCFPLFIALLVPRLLMSFINENSKVIVLAKANSRLMSNHKFLSRFKCRLSGKILRYSFFFSNLIMNYLNHFLIAMIWLFVIFLARLINVY